MHLPVFSTAVSRTKGGVLSVFLSCESHLINNVNFTELPRITMNPPNNREVVVGEENLMYSCEFEGSPTPSIQWFFNGQPIAAESGVSVSDNTLMIATPQVSNSGIYQCIVSNDFGDDQAAWLLEIRPSSK